MSAEYDSFVADRLEDLVVSPAGDYGGKASQFEELLFQSAGGSGDFTPIFLIVSNAIGREWPDVTDPARKEGYQNSAKLNVDLVGLDAVLGAFNRTDWAHFGRTKPNIRVAILQPQYVGKITMWITDGVRARKREYDFEYNRGHRMLVPCFEDVLSARVRAYYSTEYLTELIALTDEHGIIKGPSFPGKGLQELFDRMHGGCGDKMQDYWTQQGLDNLGVEQFRLGFLVTQPGLISKCVDGLGHDNFFGAFHHLPNPGFPNAYIRNEERSGGDWLLGWGSFPGGDNNIRHPTSYDHDSTIERLLHDMERLNEPDDPADGPVVRTVLNFGAGFEGDYTWLGALADIIQFMIPRG